MLQVQCFALLPPAIKKFRKKSKLTHQLKRVSQELDFFSSYSPKVNPHELKSFPIIDKHTWLANFSGLNSKGFTYDFLYQSAKNQESNRNFSDTLQGYTIGLSSGTTGNPGIILASESDRATWVATVLKKIVGLTWRKRKLAFFLRANSSLYQSVNSRILEFRYFDLSRPMDQLLTELASYQPSIIVAPATVLEYIAMNGTSSSDKKPEQLISVAEVLDAPTRNLLYEKFPGIQISEVYQATEGLLGFTCKKGKMHLNEDQVHFEYIPFQENEEKAKTRTSRIVQIIITDFTRETMPMIRYKMEDLLELEEHPCSCGNKNTVVKRIIGRKEDCLRFKNDQGKTIWLFPDLIRQWIIRADSGIQNFRVTQTEDYMLELELLTEKRTKKHHLELEALDSIQQLLNQFAKENQISQFIAIQLIDYKASIDWTTKFRRVIYKPRT